ncbi:MAG: TonB family protein [Acidobacteriia bacterium]|nr:TonB family protein [Terriglobia bacterium]
MPRALLLSPDDQAVSAITGVLEEMSVTCERPLDGASAAQKLNSHCFDLVLVDCENLPAAKLIFDVCRRGNNGNNPVPIAIVDGRAGLPTAFRLGAELILTKPVAKDQARNTIRTAVSRVRKEVPASESVPAPPASPAIPGAVTTSAVATSAVTTSPVMPERHALAAAAASLQLTSFADPAPVAAATAVPVVAPASTPAATLSKPGLTTTMHSAVDEIDAAPTAPKVDRLSTSSSTPSSPESSPARAISVNAIPARPEKLSADAVLADLQEAELRSAAAGKAVPDQQAAESAAPAFSSYQRRQQKKRGPLAALLALVLAGAAFYAAWMYQPEFRALVQPQIDRGLALVGIRSPRQSLPPAPRPAKSSPQVVAATSPAPVPASPADPSLKQSSGPASAEDSTATPAAATPVQPAVAPGPRPPAPTATTTTAPVVGKPEVGKPGDSKKDIAATTLSSAPLPGESSAIILSSKGAEKRLAHSVRPNFPVEARGEAQGTVVLKEVVDENGKIEGVRLVEGNPALAAAAIAAVKQWRYRPYVRDGKAQPFQTIVIVDFQRP